MTKNFNTPILFLVFNRPDTTQQVFNRIRAIKPKQLFIAADGAREEKRGEQEKVDTVRKLILEGIDWDCEVKTLLREKKLGCGKACSEGITWFFENVEKGIILEDDILPDLSFFSFCEELLEKYKEDERVMMISGLNVCSEWKSEVQSYHFACFGGIWGWASWRRAWKYYDIKINLWQNPEVKSLIKNFFSFDASLLESRMSLYNELFENKNKRDHTWDFQWGFAKLINSGLNIIPCTNLIHNIGCGADATHTKGDHPWSNLAIKSIENINHPKVIMADVEYDRKHLGV
jgi:hypothetical protein